MQSGTITTDEQKQQAIEKIITDQLVPFKRRYIMRTNRLQSTAEIKVSVGQAERDCAALLYQFNEWEKTEKTTTELLAVADQALTLCPYHIGLLKTCIDLAKAAETDELHPKLEIYYQQLVTNDPRTENYFAYGFFVASHPARQEDAIKIFLLGIRRDTHPDNTPNATRREALTFIIKYINVLLAQRQEKITKKADSDALPAQCELGTINSLDVHTLALQCSNDGLCEAALFCSELYVWLIVTGLDTKSENQKFLKDVLSSIARAYMNSIPQYIKKNKIKYAVTAYTDWLDTLKKFPQYKPSKSFTELTSIFFTNAFYKLLEDKKFEEASIQINDLLTGSLANPNIDQLMSFGIALFIENLLDLAEKSLDNKPLFDEAIDAIEAVHFCHASQRVTIQRRVDVLKQKAKMSRFERILQEGYQYYLADKTKDASEKLTEAILCKDAKDESRPEPLQLKHAYVLRSICTGSITDRAAAEKIDKLTTESLFYFYRRLKADVRAREIPATKLRTHVELYFAAKAASDADDHDAAIERLKEAFDIYRDNEEAWFLHGKQFYSKLDYETASKSFSNAIKLRPNQTLAYFYRALCNPLIDIDKITIDLLAGIRSYRFNAEFLNDDIIQKLSKSLVICQDQFIAEYESHAEIVNLTAKIKTDFPNCIALILERAHAWQKLNFPSQAIHDLQIAFFLVKENIATKCNAKLLIPNILCHLIVALLDRRDSADLQNALDLLRKNDFSVALPDAKEYDQFNAKQNMITSAQSRMRTGTKPKKQTPPENIQAAIESKSLVADINKILILPQNADLLKAKTRVCNFLLKYAQGGNHARVVLEDKKAFFDLCAQLNSALLKNPVVKEVKESKSSSTSPAKKPSDHAKHNKKKKEKQKLAKEKKQRPADENIAARSIEDAKKREAYDEDVQEYYEKEMLAENAHRADEQYEAYRRADEKAAAEKLASEEAEIWQQMVNEYKTHQKAEATKRKIQELARQLDLPKDLVAAMHKFKKCGARAYICGGQLRRAIRKAKNLPPILGETDSDLIIGIRAKNLSNIQALFPEAHVSQVPGDDKDGYTFKIKYPRGKIKDKFIYDKKRTVDIRVSIAISNFDIPEEEALRNHARTCDFTQGAVFYNGKLIDAAQEIGMSSALSDIENGRLVPIKSYSSDPLLPLRAIYKYGRSEGNISTADIEFFKTLTPDYFAALKPGVINNWLKKILCHGHAVKNLEKMIEAKLIENLFPFPYINHPRVIQELLDIARDTDNCYPADFDAIYSRLIQILSDVPKTKTTYHSILAQSRLFQCNFAIYKTDPNYCLTKLLSYSGNKIIPHFMHGEINSLGNIMHRSISRYFISQYAVQNFDLSMQLLDFGFKELTALLSDVKTSQLITNYLSDIAYKPQYYQLEHLYAFWILTIVASDPRLTIEAVINSNLYFKLRFSESIDKYDECFAIVRGDFIRHKNQLGIYDIPDNVLKPRPATSYTRIGKQLSSYKDEKKLVQVTGEAPKSPPIVAASPTAVAAKPAPLTTTAPLSSSRSILPPNPGPSLPLGVKGNRG